MNTDVVGVVGLGLLGRGVAACFLGHGFRVVGFARDEQEHADARPHIERMVCEMADLACGVPDLKQTWCGRFQPVTEYAAFRECSLVVESVIEDAAIKHAVFDALEAVVSPEAILASNTSAIPISLLQQPRRVPGRFLGMHWAEPAHITRFLEVIRGEQTSDAAFAATAAMARRLGKEPSLCQKDVPGFIVNRVAYAMYREACHLLEMGIADVETIDTAIRNTLGLWATLCGPLRWIDLTGGPELYAKAMQRVLPTLSNTVELPPVLQKLKDDGARGIINGRGFFEYTSEEGHRWEERYRQHARRATQILNDYFPLPSPPPGDSSSSQG